MKGGAHTLSSLYAQLRLAADRDRKTTWVFLFCMVAHGICHGLLALVAGALVRALALGIAHETAGFADHLDARSGLGKLASSALGLAMMGFGLALAKGISAVFGARAQASLVLSMGQGLRERVLSTRLDGAVGQPGQVGPNDHGPLPELAEASDPVRTVASLTTHVRDVEQAVSTGLLQATRAAFELVAVLGALVLVEPRLAFFALVVLGPFALLLGRLRRGWKVRQGEVVRESEALFSAADQATRHADLFRVFGAEELARREVRTLGARLVVLGEWLAARAQLLSSGNEVLGALALVLVVLGASQLPLESREKLVPFAVIFFLAYKPLRDLSDARLAWAKGETSLEALGLENDLGTAARELSSVSRSGADGHASGGVRPRSFSAGTLEVRGLELPFGEATAPVSFVLEPGQIVGVVAPTGYGKSTLLRVLLGLVPARSGEVWFDGACLDGALPRDRPFAWVPQEAPVLAASIADNVSLGRDDLPARAPLDALESLGAFAARASVDGSVSARAEASTRVGPGGRTLSGGERQWVSLARALVTDKPVLLLDEPTSGLDRASQARVLRAIEALRGTRSVLLVTHRREALAICDRVIELG
jgi:ABC-type multidrug transport system fused ATPase/permease subunit